MPGIKSLGRLKKMAQLTGNHLHGDIQRVTVDDATTITATNYLVDFAVDAAILNPLPSLVGGFLISETI